jgi:hypothetical protein
MLGEVSWKITSLDITILLLNLVSLTISKTKFIKLFQLFIIMKLNVKLINVYFNDCMELNDQIVKWESIKSNATMAAHLFDQKSSLKCIGEKSQTS